jgi:hypothetical protein
MRILLAALLVALTPIAACRRQQSPPAAVPAQTTDFAGFDRNLYPGDDRLAALHQRFAYAGYWLTPPPGETTNTWAGKRAAVRAAGLGFLVLSNGKLDREIKNSSLGPAELGRQDAAAATAAAKSEGFPAGTIVFLDQEEGGRLLPGQAEYLLAWTEAVAQSPFKPGVYLSGQPVPDGNGPDGKPVTITTAGDVREQIAAKHLHPVTLWVAQDTCGPSPGCTLPPPPIKQSGTLDADVWQYAQTPRRPELTRSCAKTYAPDNNCYAPGLPDLFLDLNVATSADPSHGR